jgi:Glycosyltransferase WbsX/Repeat of unknown function (DUF5648)
MAMLATLCSALPGFGPTSATAHAAAPSGPLAPVPLYQLRAQDGKGWFSTLSATEAQGAVSHYGFSRQQSGYVAYLWRSSFPGSQPIYRLRNLNAPGYLYTASQAERDALVSGRYGYHFADEGLLGYGSTTQQQGMVGVHRLSDNGTWRLARDSEVGGLVGQGYHDDGVITFAYPRWIRAGAIYFGAWDSYSTMIMGATQTWCTRSGDWWGGVRDYSGLDPSTGTCLDKYKAHWGNVDWSYLKPSIGWYDDSQPATLEKQINEATGAGLSYFSFYWYWNGPQHRMTGNVEVDSFLKASNSSAMNFDVTICAPDIPELRISTGDFSTVAGIMVDRYLSQPNYLRDNDGRPILQLCDQRGIGDAAAYSDAQLAQVKTFVQDVRSLARQKLGTDILVITYDGEMLRPGTGPNPIATASGADGTSCMANPDIPSNDTYQHYVANLPAYMSQNSPPVFGRCAMQNFDERPRYPILIQDASKVRYYRDRTDALYQQALTEVGDNITGSWRISPIDNYVFLYAWNEWHEGGILEPNARDGCRQLDIVQQSLQLTGPGCLPAT